MRNITLTNNQENANFLAQRYTTSHRPEEKNKTTKFQVLTSTESNGNADALLVGVETVTTSWKIVQQDQS